MPPNLKQNMVIVDTGFWLALADRQDTNHKLAKQTLRKIDEPLITTWCVVTETCYMLLTRKGVPAQTAFMTGIANGAFELFDLQNHQKNGFETPSFSNAEDGFTSIKLSTSQNACYNVKHDAKSIQVPILPNARTGNPVETNVGLYSSRL